jgi:hypothetical protein
VLYCVSFHHIVFSSLSLPFFFSQSHGSASAAGAMVLGRVGLAQCRYCKPDDDKLTQCRYCKPDDDKLSSLQDELNAKFCSKLQSSGSKVLAHSRDCSVAFLDMSAGKADQAQVTLKGLLHDFTEEDTAIFNEAVAAAYNDAFLSAGHSIGSVQAVADVDMVSVSQCRYCKPDDDMLTAPTSSKVILAHVGVGQCRYCKPDDDSYDVERSQHDLMEAAFKKTVCVKLQSSGSANFANVHGCDFSFVYSAVGAEAKVLMAIA